jgi:hypothetical protein
VTNRLDVIGIELIVDDLDRAIELLSGIVGFELISRAPSDLVAGELAILDAGPIVISLLHPAASGPGSLLAERTPRLSQIVVASAAMDEARELRETAMDAGLAVAMLGEDSFHLTPEAVEGALGQPVAIVVTTLARS